MKVCFLISGLLRQFQNSLLPFLNELEKHLDFDVYIHSSNQQDDTKFSSIVNTQTLHEVLIAKYIRMFMFEKLSDTICPQSCSQREKNTYYQWYRIKRLFQSISDSSSYDLYIRIRPDIRIECTPEYFLSCLQSISLTHITIPSGNNIFDSKYIQKDLSLQPINDQVAFIPRSFLSVYASLYDTLSKTETTPIISEYCLAKQLETHQVPIVRIDLPYSIVLSSCKVLAIAGDSSSGKSTILNAIQEVFPFDSYVTVETDRYHKWERDNEQWKSITHLHPNANHLEKLLDDTYRLKIGENVYMVDYDHSSGKFTEIQQVNSKENILLCGLHTLYQQELREHLDIKLYIDTEVSLKTFWKIQRDHIKRGYTVDQVLQKIKERENDFNMYIVPQKKFANILIHYKLNGNLPSDYLQPITENTFCMEIMIHKSLLPICYFTLISCSSQFKIIDQDFTCFSILPNLSSDLLREYAKRENLQRLPFSLRSGYLGVIQLLIIRLFFIDLK